MLSSSNPRLGPVRRALVDAGRELLQFAIAEYARPTPLRFAADGRPLDTQRPIDGPPDVRASYQPIQGCPWCQVNLRLAGVAYALERAIAFPQATAAYVHMARNELVGVRAMLAGNPGEVQVLENPIGQLQLRLLAQDADLPDVAREVAHIMEIATRAAETPGGYRAVPPVDVGAMGHATNRLAASRGAIATGERVTRGTTEPHANGSSDVGDGVRDPGARSPAG